MQDLRDEYEGQIRALKIALDQKEQELEVRACVDRGVRGVVRSFTHTTFYVCDAFIMTFVCVCRT